MHIVFVVGFFSKNKYEALSGMPGYVYKICRCLVSKGHECKIVTSSKEDRLWDYNGIEVNEVYNPFQIDAGFMETNVAIIYREWAFQKCLKRINRCNKIDVVQYAGWSGVGAFHSVRCPAVLRLSTYTIVQYKNSELFHYKQLLSFWERLAGRRSDAIISPGIELAKAFRNDVKREVTIIETPYFETEKKEDYNALKRTAGLRYVLFAGSLSEDKGFQMLIEAIPSLLERHLELYFVVAGWNHMSNGISSVEQMRDALGKDEGRFIYLGVLPHSQLVPIIRKAELMLIPSIIDNLPNICLEAMFLDKIVIGTRKSTIDQMIHDGENGFLAEPGDSTDFLECVEKGLGLSSEEKLKMIEKQRSFRKPYEEDRAVLKLLAFYEDLLDNHKEKRLRSKRVKLK